MQVPSPEQLADAGPWAAFAFLALGVIALAFYLLRMLLARELRRADAAEAELVTTRKELADTKAERTELAGETGRLRRLLATYEETDVRLKRSTAKRRRDDA